MQSANRGRASQLPATTRLMIDRTAPRTGNATQKWGSATGEQTTLTFALHASRHHARAGASELLQTRLYVLAGVALRQSCLNEQTPTFRMGGETKHLGSWDGKGVAGCLRTSGMRSPLFLGLFFTNLGTLQGRCGRQICRQHASLWMFAPQFSTHNSEDRESPLNYANGKL